jgi:uncharacterized membrane protein YeaQ/YmgE (transglycosylase-associated protein family)
MNIVIWMLAGGIAGWIACSALKLNVERGLVVSAVIGVVGAFFGGHVVAAAFSGGVSPSGAFNPVALLIASATAIVALKIADVVYRRFEF